MWKTLIFTLPLFADYSDLIAIIYHVEIMEWRVDFTPMVNNTLP